jgi:uncharacterized protein YndB with AHSA1/START domain
MTRLEGREDIARPPEEVFAFLADPRNDSEWCPRVLGCELRSGDGVEVGARFVARHSPSLKRAHERTIDVLELDAPHRIVTSQRDQVADFTITYELEPTATGTALTQRDDIDWNVPFWQVPVARPIVRRHIPSQLATLKQVLEAG